MTFTLSGKALVQLNSSGMQKLVSGNYMTGAYRLFIDGTAQGHADSGQRQKMSTAENPSDIWVLTGFETLGAGTHTIEVQARNCDGEGVGTICGDSVRGISAPDNTGISCALNVLAIYQ